jgi:DNA-binding transcriptional regulator GbsR (MarR family)
MRHRKVLSDNEWTGWLRWMKSIFERGKIKEYWEINLEVERWFDPAFEEFINKELAPTVKVNK